jgi:hypothetical protein
MEIVPNMVSSPPVASSMFHSASPIYSRVEESSANTPASSTNRSDIDKGNDIERTIVDLPVEYRRKFEAINLKMEEAFMPRYDVIDQGLVLRDTEMFAFDIYKAMSKVEITAEQNNSSDDVQSSDCIYVPSQNGSTIILGSYPTANSKVKLQDSDDMHNSKISAAEDHQEDSASNGIIEETSHPASNIDMAKQQASSLVSANKIGGHIFNDVKETDIAIKKSILTILNKPSRCVAEWIDVDLAPFICSTLNPVVQNNRQNKIRYTFEISNCGEIFDILVLEKRIRIPVDHVISSFKELGKCVYCKRHDSFSHSTCDCNVFHRRLQSAIDEGRLKFRDHLNTGGHASHSQILPKRVINLEGKKILVRQRRPRQPKIKMS